ncbi:ADP-ribose pyrophosphatase YjhB, NUDIX family [Terribacillus halophilus]|uniref:ADP-ribose pyrophosphatase YjhB, NUDIX family n=1 Tax=Terribacillus halophilus TaxID=361279 RepID=A0A1G6TTW8_9BACI|nr:NUDIX domain-containing protein [Terribacillus halophilus]SDD32479.1 ADP-ribose pyrophosphatase YjhB, NUDIX family [Terribacillus halophilus]
MKSNKEVKHYDVSRYRTPDGYTSDIAVFTITSERTKAYAPPKMELKLMLIKRADYDTEGNPNIEAGKWALPGGFVTPEETAQEAASRELSEETGIDGIPVKHFGVYDQPERDPRGWIISNAHYAIVPEHQLFSRKANDDAADVELFSVEELEWNQLAFDHSAIICDAIAHISRDLLQTTVAKQFLPESFTYSELQAVLLTITDDKAIRNEQAFARKIKSLPFIEAVEGQKTQRTSKLPTQLYRFVETDIKQSIYTARH